MKWNKSYLSFKNYFKLAGNFEEPAFVCPQWEDAMALTDETQRAIIWEKIWLTSKLAILKRGPRIHQYVWFWKLTVGMV